ncbi:MAG: hypothetical protein KF757_03480 [Phycisphaeraceae bacterium]|nr:hypothetical protein [Phycisphaeraceae bacterium]MCW5763065.1 hypothetical protein [Phycisphaeraceae bacterium]
MSAPNSEPPAPAKAIARQGCIDDPRSIMLNFFDVQMFLGLYSAGCA